MAIATVLGGDSRIFSGGSRHKGLRVGFHVRLRHHLLGRALPRDELKSAVDNGHAWVRRSSAEARPGDTKRATLCIPGKLTWGIARLN